MIEEERLVRLDVVTYDPQEEVRLSHQRVAFENLRVLTDGLLESQQRVPPMASELHMGEHHDVQADLLAIEEGDAILEDSQLLQAAYPSPACGCGHSDPFGHIGRGQVSMLLQHFQNPDIPPIQLDLHQISHFSGQS